ncbi:alpha/beta hydrolase [Streptomyces sp. NPDC101132]|uniref:alpha/beta hydrolase n=1 Tax=Streptomyces sp. NPDC101132 TaxID=3366110 RepID=UPI0038172F69
MTVQEVLLDAGGVPLSGLLAEPAGGPPRALVLALHGGGMRAGYFDSRVVPGLSLLELGSRLGYAVLALDRPGYGASAAALPDGLPVSGQARTVRAALAGFAREHAVGAGVFVLAHSNGGKLALALAADASGGGPGSGSFGFGSFGSGSGSGSGPSSGPGFGFGSDPGPGPGSGSGSGPSSGPGFGFGSDPGPGSGPALLGLDVSGIGSRFAVGPELMPGPDTAGDWRRHWGALRCYPPDALRRGQELLARVPDTEALEGPRWPELYPAIAARVRVPVRFTFAEQERWWRHDEEAVAALTAPLASAVVRVDRQPDAGHNISLGWAARTYHLRALGFLEECLLARDAAAPSRARAAAA